MRIVPLAAIPNQSLSVRLDDVRMVLRIKEANGVMVADLERAAVQIVSGTRVLAGETIIPYHYLEQGNFLLVTISDELPDWRLFGISQYLVYITAAEVAALRAAPLTVGDMIAADENKTRFLYDGNGFYLFGNDDELLIEG